MQTYIHTKTQDMNVRNSITNNCKEVKMQMPINWWVKKQNVEYSYNRLYDKKREKYWNILQHVWKLKTCLVKEARHQTPHTV